VDEVAIIISFMFSRSQGKNSRFF